MRGKIAGKCATGALSITNRGCSLLKLIREELSPAIQFFSFLGSLAKGMTDQSNVIGVFGTP